jgi:hypothetical protein
MENYERLEKVGEGAPFPLPLPPFHEDLVAFSDFFEALIVLHASARDCSPCPFSLCVLICSLEAGRLGVALLITVPPPFSPTGTYGTVYKCRQVSTVLRLPCQVDGRRWVGRSRDVGESVFHQYRVRVIEERARGTHHRSPSFFAHRHVRYRVQVQAGKHSPQAPVPCQADQAGDGWVDRGMLGKASFISTE